MFSYDIQTSIDIDAEPGAIWQVLTDFSSYGDWNPMLRNVQTELEPGAPVRFEVLREGADSLKLKANITTLDEPLSLVWRGGSVAIISGEHYFRLEPLSEGRCRFHHGEHFAGVILPLVKGTLKNTPELYRAMNEALKRRVEDRAHSAPGADMNQQTRDG
jgi:hypothetical protein